MMQNHTDICMQPPVGDLEALHMYNDHGNLSHERDLLKYVLVERCQWVQYVQCSTGPIWVRSRKCVGKSRPGPIYKIRST